MVHTLPQDVEKYAETAIFTDESHPEKLTRLHDTKDGVWGRLVILEGEINYIIPGDPETVQLLSPGIEGIIFPAEKHRVEMIGPVKFKIEFYKTP